MAPFRPPRVLARCLPTPRSGSPGPHAPAAFAAWHTVERGKDGASGVAGRRVACENRSAAGSPAPAIARNLGRPGSRRAVATDGQSSPGRVGDRRSEGTLADAPGNGPGHSQSRTGTAPCPACRIAGPRHSPRRLPGRKRRGHPGPVDRLGRSDRPAGVAAFARQTPPGRLRHVRRALPRPTRPSRLVRPHGSPARISAA